MDGDSVLKELDFDSIGTFPHAHPKSDKDHSIEVF